MLDASADSKDDTVDPQIRAFITRMAEGFAGHPSLAELDFPQARAVAETVRAPWREGGPRMQATTEHQFPTPEGPVRVRIYDPGTGPAAAALVYMHGGGWTLFSLDTHDRLMREYAARAGVKVVGVDYALSPEAKFPVALHQVAAVVQHLREAAACYGIDPSRIAVGGDSAGGNLSLAAALKLRDDGAPDAIRAILLNYAAIDTESSEAASQSYGGERYMLGDGEMRDFWRNYLRSPADASNPLARPSIARLEGLPPVHLAIAECDLLCEQNLALAERLSAAGVENTAVVYRGATHSFLEAVSVSQIADRALQTAAEWLTQTLALPGDVAAGG